MTPRFVLIVAAVFVGMLMLYAWHEGLWGRSAQEHVATTPPAPQPLPALQPTAAADSPSAQPGVPDVAPDSTDPGTSERERSERHREAVRGARTR
jgi:hypothetical protein